MGISLTRVLVVVAALTGATSCKKKETVEAKPVAAPIAAGTEGASCYNGPCNPGLTCTPRTIVCARPDHPELVEARQLAAERERAFLAHSGVEVPTHAEQPPPAAPPAAPPVAPSGGAVRIVHVTNDGKGSWVIAACRPDERLIGGSCQIGQNALMNLPSFPVSAQPTDTTGGHWNCGWRDLQASDLKLEAYALCQRL